MFALTMKLKLERQEFLFLIGILIVALALDGSHAVGSSLVANAAVVLLT